MRIAFCVLVIIALLAAPALALDRPWISDTFFYWYTWDYEKELGGWVNGIYNTPLQGYYDSLRYEDNLASIHQASEWGITHHFMDYWGQGWKDHEGNPREDALIRATEDLQKRGYDTFMSIYQDGTDFDMAEFSRNLDPGRDTEFYVKRYSDSPAYPRIGGKPVFLIYGRNGKPKNTATDEGFRAWLAEKHGTIGALNQRWGAGFEGFEDVELGFSAKGHQRAESIKYQYRVWEEEMARADRLAKERFGLPGCTFSWDIAWQPFKGYSYSDQARVFCGPHSYGGVFGVPHQSDVERFIQAQVAKRYDTVFFDSFKNFYHDWEIRIPGTCYPADFCAFDRFWVQALAHYSEALLHLSWNEWWEGSNLEPCYEFGKIYCEKNLLYSTIMKQCFAGIHNWSEGARAAVLLNDWHWLAGGRNSEDIYACIQALRRNNIRFDLLPDDFVTAEELGRFDVVIAPAAGVGFGYNADDRAIADLLMAWAREDAKRKLLVDDYPGLAGALGLKAAPTEATEERGADMSVYVDVGEEGDDEFLVDGSSGREDWGKLSAGEFGATDRKHTVRWTPAEGRLTTFMLPFSPNREHVLRLKGSALWGNRVSVLINGEPGAEFEVTSGDNAYEVSIPAEAIGGAAFGELTLRYDKLNIPNEMAPEKYDTEARVCNLAIDWLQLATAGREFSTEQDYTIPASGVRFGEGAPGELAGQELESAYVRHLTLAATDGTLSAYTRDGAARDVAVGNILYVNGLFSALEGEAYLDGLLRDWAGCASELKIEAQDIIATPLRAGDTEIILAYNYAGPEKRKLTLELPSIPRQPIVEVNVLSRDGKAQQEASVDYTSTSATLRDELEYYGVYQVTRGSVALSAPPITLAPGEKRLVALELEHRARGPRAETIEGTVCVVSHLPSLTSDVAEFRVAPGEKASALLTIAAREDIDWGEKTMVFDVEVGDRHSYFWRTVLVKRMPDLQITTPVIDARAPKATVEAVEFPWAKDAAATDVRLTALGAETEVGTLAAANASEIVLAEAPPAGDEPEFKQVPAKLDYLVRRAPQTKEVTLGFATYPDAFPRAEDAVAPMIAVNPHDEYLENCLVSTMLGRDLLGEAPTYYVREKGGNVVPSQWNGVSLIWTAMLPPKSATLYYLCAGDIEQPQTDLAMTEDDDGVTISNSRFSLHWSKDRGGTVTSFVSRASGRDYGAGSFGGGFGTWGKFDPLSPRTNTIEFVGQEKKTWQRDCEGEVEFRVLVDGPAQKTLKVDVRAEGVRYEQSYNIGAYQSHFSVMSWVHPDEPTEEIVGLDVRLARNNLTKIFPNFTGVGAAFSEDEPTAGWREATYIPPYATMMTPNGFEESISVIPWGAPDVLTDRFRQGFWPEKRPEAGPIEYAQIELAATDAEHASGHAHILLHSGHQVVAKRFRKTHVDQPPEVIIPEEFTWDGELAESPEAGAEGWWNPYWHFALPVAVAPEEGLGEDPAVTLKVDFGNLLGEEGTFDPASPRAIARSEAGVTELPMTGAPTTGELTVTLTDAAWPGGAGDTREFMLYFDTIENGPKRMRPTPEAALSARLLNGAFEEGGLHWGGSTQALQKDGGREGSGCARLQCKPNMGPVVVQNSTMRVRPQTEYRVTFWAKTTSPDAAIRANYYADANHDSPQFAIPITPDGEWRQYEQTLPVGAFPAGIHLALRFWVLGTPQTVWLDDVEVEAPEPVEPPREPLVGIGEMMVR